ncbi:hypothetical protein [Luteimonas terrae]|uniref:Transmembrane protein n=1 Tax=Luteimonas terrae TaxID=1530191 RepID=A0ABU1Y1H8_9GAMM|nr:hypothetical protein [Luteimonas terrae]MDR7194211.1 hypothetical protein [Luteimonas terrae]
MSPAVAQNLALLLFLPWFLILGVLFWVYPRQPRGARRVVFDLVSLAASVIAFLLSIHWAHAVADRDHGSMWAQILATAVGYGVFLAVLGAAFALRTRALRSRG